MPLARHELTHMMRALGAVALLITALSGGTSASHQPNFSCAGPETEHGYSMTSGLLAGEGESITGVGAAGVAYKARVVDGCEIATGVSDGEHEYGIGGAALPSGPDASCSGPAAVSHHVSGVGASYWAMDFVGSIAYVAATDGRLLADEPCLTNGVITSDPVIDPFDCVGSVGIYWIGVVWMQTTLEPNVPDLGDCHGGDGFVWVFVLEGAVVVDETTFVSSPTSGHIWDGTSDQSRWSLPLVFCDP